MYVSFSGHFKGQQKYDVDDVKIRLDWNMFLFFSVEYASEWKKRIMTETKSKWWRHNAIEEEWIGEPPSTTTKRYEMLFGFFLFHIFFLSLFQVLFVTAYNSHSYQLIILNQSIYISSAPTDHHNI